MIQPAAPSRSMCCEQRLLCERGAFDLFVRRFTLTEGDAARTVLLVHGATEHGQRYAHVAELLVECGWNVVIADLRGHGRSGGRPMHVGDFLHYVRDVQRAREHFALDPERTALVGHSMGGLVAALAALDERPIASAVVLLAPLLGVRVRVPATTVAAGRMLSFVAPGTRFQSRVDPHDVTRNPIALARRDRDPFNHRHVTAGWYFAMKAALRSVWKRADRMRLPLLVVQGSDDRIVDAARSRAWVDAVASTDRAYCELPGHLHELHNEPNWRETLTDVALWLDPRVPATRT
ncbi:MAG: lysophospholipase [Planctomycetales bacterium]